MLEDIVIYERFYKVVKHRKRLMYKTNYGDLFHESLAAALELEASALHTRIKLFGLKSPRVTEKNVRKWHHTSEEWQRMSDVPRG